MYSQAEVKYVNEEIQVRHVYEYGLFASDVLNYYSRVTNVLIKIPKAPNKETKNRQWEIESY